jgi:hypothetical protein
MGRRLKSCLSAAAREKEDVQRTARDSLRREKGESYFDLVRTYWKDEDGSGTFSNNLH